LRKQGIGNDFFEEVAVAGDKLAAEIREQTFALTKPPLENIFDFVYSDPHPEIEQQKAWLKAYEEQMGSHE
jgi:pyruvate dehydrogenase E1 component alpha subunit